MVDSKTHKRWSVEDDTILRSLYESKSRAEIAEAMGLRESQVRSRLWTLGIATKSPRWSDGDLAELRRAYTEDDPVNVKALSARLGRDDGNVSMKAGQLGLTDKNRKRVKERKVRLPKFDSREERLIAQGIAVKARIAANGHPRGALGLTHSVESRAKMGEASRAAWRDPESGFHTEEFSQKKSDYMVSRTVARRGTGGYNRTSTTAGKRADLGNLYVRSLWEANYARYLKWLVANGKISSWEYEPKTFVFEPIKRGTRTYTPDFLIHKLDGTHEWHEVKGWMDQKSRTRLDRMAKYFPDERIVLIEEPWFVNAKKQGLRSIVPGWEVGKSSR